MPIIARAFVAVVFIGLMFLVKDFIIKPVAHLGYIPGLLMIAGILWLGFKIDNKERKANGEPVWSAYEAGQEVRAYFREPTPYILLGLLGGCLLIAWAGL